MDESCQSVAAEESSRINEKEWVPVEVELGRSTADRCGGGDYCNEAKR